LILLLFETLANKQLKTVCLHGHIGHWRSSDVLPSNGAPCPVAKSELSLLDKNIEG
jgi:hypothetical protein